jgi:hypothetical protein
MIYIAKLFLIKYQPPTSNEQYYLLLMMDRVKGSDYEKMERRGDSGRDRIT